MSAVHVIDASGSMDPDQLGRAAQLVEKAYKPGDMVILNDGEATVATSFNEEFHVAQIHRILANGKHGGWRTESAFEMAAAHAKLNKIDVYDVVYYGDGVMSAEESAPFSALVLV